MQAAVEENLGLRDKAVFQLMSTLFFIVAFRLAVLKSKQAIYVAALPAIDRKLKR